MARLTACRSAGCTRVSNFFIPGKTLGKSTFWPSTMANSNASLARSQRKACMFAMFIDSLSHPVLFSRAICASFCACTFCTEPKERNGRPSKSSRCPMIRTQMR